VKLPVNFHAQFFKGLAAAHHLDWATRTDPIRQQSSIGKLAARRRYANTLLNVKRIKGDTRIAIATHGNYRLAGL
jgi:hypothetical protein